MKNNLKNQTNPYLLQHADNPVHWYPWCEEAFQKAKSTDRPIFLSIGYSTCHWCHVMAHESFEDEEIAEFLNRNFVSIKVDKEERPDIDSVYMAVCQAFTGSGGWPTSIFMTPEQKPFFAGTYFPKKSNPNMIGFSDLLRVINEKWNSSRSELISSGEEIIKHLNSSTQKEKIPIDHKLIADAISHFKKSFDKTYGGFGPAPKFPSAHNLMFLMKHFELTGNKDALEMVETTLLQMFKGGIFDHIGYGFSRYSTDRFFLVPHFEKMLYDNALLLMSYANAYLITDKLIYRNVAEKTARYLLREMTGPEGEFYSAQDADSDGVEGKYYVFQYDEIIHLLGPEIGSKFSAYFGISENGNFEGTNILNLLHHSCDSYDLVEPFDSQLTQLYQYRKIRTNLHLDDKILTAWNSLMISAFSMMYRIVKETSYLDAAKKANEFIESHLQDGTTLYVSYRNGSHSGKGFLDDYADYTLSLIHLYEATLDNSYLEKAVLFCNKTILDFYDSKSSGFYLYGSENEPLIMTPKETYDGAMPSGNSVMAYNLVKLSQITHDTKMENLAKQQLAFMSTCANDYPAGYSFFLLALSIYLSPDKSVVAVLKSPSDLESIRNQIDTRTSILILESPTDAYKLLNDKTTFYICKNQSCLPPTNDFMAIYK